MRLRSLLPLVVVLAVAALTARPAAAQKSCEFLVGPSGGAFDVPISAAYLTSLAFPQKLGQANTSDTGDYEIRRDGDTGMLVRPRTPQAKAANITITSGTMRVSVGLRIAPDAKDACALVTFRATTEEEARQRAIDEAVAARTAALDAQLAALKRDVAAQVRAQLDGAIADRAVSRLDIARLNAVERNDAGVVVWVLRVAYLGRDALVNVEIENRSTTTARVADIEIRNGAKNVATAARLVSGAGNGAIGTVAPGAKVRGVVFVRDLATAGKAPTLVVRFLDGAPVTVGGLGLR
jgi:hypothetical protein